MKIHPVAVSSGKSWSPTFSPSSRQVVLFQYFESSFQMYSHPGAGIFTIFQHDATNFVLRLDYTRHETTYLFCSAAFNNNVLFAVAE